MNVFFHMVHIILVTHTICGKDDAIKQSVIISSMEGYYKYSKVDGQCNVSEKNRLPLFSSDRNLRLIARAQQLTDPPGSQTPTEHCTAGMFQKIR